MSDPQLIRQIETLRRQFDKFIKPETLNLSGRLGVAIGTLLSLPGMSGLWTMSTGNNLSTLVADISVYRNHLTVNGDPVLKLHNEVTGYAEFDGTGDFLDDSTRTQYEITGDTTLYDSSIRGFTLGGWFWLDDNSSARAIFNKYETTGNQRSYALHSNTDTTITFTISDNGTDTFAVTSTELINTSEWHFVIGRFLPSTEMAVFIDNIKAVNTTSIPSAIYDSTADFIIGSGDIAAGLLDGRASLCFICNAALPDKVITNLFSQTRPLFTV